MENSAMLKVFFAYAREDEDLLNELNAHLSVLKRQKNIEVWHDREIIPGTVWNEEIKLNLTNADIVLLLISAHFLASEYIWNIEMKTALEQHDRGESVVIPIVLRSCNWRDTPLGTLQVLPKDGNPVLSKFWHCQDDALTNVVEGVHKAVNGLVEQKLKDADYANFKTTGDEFYELKDYYNAKIKYDAAYAIKRSVTVKKLIKDCEQKLYQNSINENYQNLVLQANKYFYSARYSDARKLYMDAEKIKTNLDVKSKIKICEEKISKVEFVDPLQPGLIEDNENKKVDLLLNKINKYQNEKLYEEALILAKKALAFTNPNSIEHKKIKNLIFNLTNLSNKSSFWF